MTMFPAHLPRRVDEERKLVPGSAVLDDVPIRRESSEDQLVRLPAMRAQLLHARQVQIGALVQFRVLRPMNEQVRATGHGYQVGVGSE